MYEKYKTCEFGRCPRVLCNGQPCLPVGTCDVPRQSTVKIFCPKCQDIYYPRSKYQVPQCSYTCPGIFLCSSYRSHRFHAGGDPAHATDSASSIRMTHLELQYMLFSSLGTWRAR